MKTFSDKIQDFIQKKSIAVTGVSRSNESVANLLFRKFSDAGYEVFAINPNADSVEGVTSYPDLASIKRKPEAVVIASPPQSARKIIDDCIQLNINNIWFHSSIDKGSLDEEAADYAEQKGLTVIRTGCPMMYVKPVDFPHKCMKWFLKLTGKIPSK